MSRDLYDHQVGDTVDWYGEVCTVLEIEYRQAGFPYVRIQCPDGSDAWELAHQLERVEALPQ